MVAVLLVVVEVMVTKPVECHVLLLCQFLWQHLRPTHLRTMMPMMIMMPMVTVVEVEVVVVMASMRSITHRRCTESTTSGTQIRARDAN
uniref:IAA-alanine resistance protein 1 isoform X2 n=1 Tax=Rhizophora mucronata TaxID=61149 RepID=A0A2P2IWL1_RHIMU